MKIELKPDSRYDPNTFTWRRGDVVIHHADAKKRYMLMRVIGYTRDGLVKTRYIFPEMSSALSKKSTRAIWENELKYLLDPKKFDIDITKLPPPVDV